eukprot:TRINITY_DN704_c0_g1_i7.p1 TRINITY_DN704_c0_g1~~TRINITY_DN704_c0_g1_i7.p1  ORF type:complete len:281 (-),score=26.69 TRINITY_DN704_c0_g1_i7:1005-1847(-)
MTKAHFSHFLTIAATATALSVVLSLLLVKNHLQHYTRPRLQKYTVRIVLMVPIYAVDSLLSLLMPEYSSVMNAMREIYEAFVIYTFLNLLIAYSGGEPLLVAIFLDKPTLKHPKPFDQCIASYTPNAAFLRTCKQGILQYVFIKPLTGLIALLLSFWGLYGDGEILFHKGYVYLTFINNISVSVSMYYLVLFYQTTKDDLARFNPLAKFICVKSVVFLTFWQSVVIAGLVWVGIITDVEDYPADALAISLQVLILILSTIIIILLDCQRRIRIKSRNGKK